MTPLLFCAVARCLTDQEKAAGRLGNENADTQKDQPPQQPEQQPQQQQPLQDPQQQQEPQQQQGCTGNRCRHHERNGSSFTPVQQLQDAAEAHHDHLFHGGDLAAAAAAGSMRAAAAAANWHHEHSQQQQGAVLLAPLMASPADVASAPEHWEELNYSPLWHSELMGGLME